MCQKVSDKATVHKLAVYELIHKLLSRRYEKGTSSATLSDDKSRSTVEHKYEVDLAKVRYRFEIFQ